MGENGDAAQNNLNDDARDLSKSKESDCTSLVAFWVLLAPSKHSADRCEDGEDEDEGKEAIAELNP